MCRISQSSPGQPTHRLRPARPCPLPPLSPSRFGMVSACVLAASCFAPCSLACRWHSFTSRGLIYCFLGKDLRFCLDLDAIVCPSILDLHITQVKPGMRVAIEMIIPHHDLVWTPAPLSFCLLLPLARHFSTFLRNPRACQEQNGAAASDALEESEGTKQEVIIAE